MTTKTIVYIDGYNLYYGRLRNNTQNCKWLDVVKLLQHIVNEQSPNNEIVKVKYFTAPALGKFASHGNKSSEAQQTYHRALKQLYPDLIEIIEGTQSIVPKPLPEYINKDCFDKTKRQWVWLLEEKMTDVAIALAMYRDTMKGHCEQIVLCSNDSDMKPALEAIKQDSPNCKIGIVMPISPPDKTATKARRVSGSLEKLSDWTRHHINDDELLNALFPEKIPTKKKPILKPSHW